MIAAVRVAALDVLTSVSSRRVDLPTAIEQVRARLGDARDRALVTEIASGVQRHRNALDFLIERCATRPLDRVDPEILDVLRLSAYQLLHLTRVPAAAAVDDAVALTRRIGKSSATGFVNAVLRTLSRRRARLPLPPRPADPADREAALAYLTVTLSHPRWLVERWLDRLGFARTEVWLLFNNQPAPLTLRANRCRTTAEALQARLDQAGIVTRRGRYAPDALVVERPYDPAALQALASQYVPQDEASQLVPLLAGPRPGPLVLDTCAAPGGKTTALAAALPEGGRVVACDVRDARMRLLRQTVQTAGAADVWLVQADFRHEPPFRRLFDCVLVDAPCSGLGVLRREPDIKWKREPADLERFAVVQLELLKHASAAVAPGGRLVYATCSSEPVENEEVARRFAAELPRFRPVDARSCHPDLPADAVDDDGFLRTAADRHGLEAFFGAVFESTPD
jgi:16S rRNA (cytosine967-C5)-methyltransferase